MNSNVVSHRRGTPRGQQYRSYLCPEILFLSNLSQVGCSIEAHLQAIRLCLNPGMRVQPFRLDRVLKRFGKTRVHEVIPIRFTSGAKNCQNVTKDKGFEDFPALFRSHTSPGRLSQKLHCLARYDYRFRILLLGITKGSMKSKILGPPQKKKEFG